MNKEFLLCRNILEKPQITQRGLAETLEVSLGTANRMVRECMDKGLIAAEADGYRLTEQGLEYMKPYRVDGAVILAAGFGSRFVPLTFETPKGLLEVFGERMIERQIRQLHEADIHNIIIVVGYLKEKFEYLIDQYGVKLIYNPEYLSKNNLASVYYARNEMQGKNMYLLSSDNWMRENLYHTYECDSWYSAVYKEGETSEWCFSLNKKGKVLSVKSGGRDAWVMYGSVFLSSSFLSDFLPVLEAYYHTPGTEQFYWEHVYLEMLNGTAENRLRDFPESAAGDAKLQTLLRREPPELYINKQPDDMVYEFENLEELRRFDRRYREHSDNEALELIARVFQIPESEIHEIRCVKAGMTNQSFLFEVQGRPYICRVPGPGTGLLINRRQEADAFKAVQPLGISEHVIYFDSETGYKIAEYYEGARNADASSESDMRTCMKLLKQLHHSGVTVGHEFDIRERIGFYEKLCLNYGEIPFEDYREVKAHMTELMDGLDRLNRPKVLAHVDSVADNFLFLPDGQLKLIDLEYAGMCDPLIDVAMCAIYSYYNDDQVDQLIQWYLERRPTEEEETVIYSYVALGGFLWSLWTVYKHYLGQEFGEYSIIMYRYAKRFYRKILLKSS